MKKISILAIVGFILSFTSCKKAYKCECTTTDDYGSNISTRDISKTSKKTAQAICGNSTDVYTESFSSGSGTSGPSQTSITNCNLK